MNNADNKYDFVSEFNQGVAIVVKNGLYGVILMGGNEIIAPIYDYISPFKDGYAQAIRKGECKILNLSGRECKRYKGDVVAIPAKYDTVRDFKNGYACVQLNGKWGAIDVNGNVIYEPQFDYLSDFVGGTAKYKMEDEQHDNSWGFLNTDGFRSECNLMEPTINSDGTLIIASNESIKKSNGSEYVGSEGSVFRCGHINNKGQLLVKNGDSFVVIPEIFFQASYSFKNGLAIVQDSTGYWGAVDINGRIVIDMQYKSLDSFSENKAFAINKNGKLCLISNNGTIIKEFPNYTRGYCFEGGYARVSNGDKYGLIDSQGQEILPLQDGFICHTENSQEFDIISYRTGGKHGLFLVSTGLFIKPIYKNIVEVNKNCIKVAVEEIGECLLDLSGKAFIENNGKKKTFPDWCKGLKEVSDNIFVGLAENGKWGLLDITGKTLLEPIFDKIGEVVNGIIPLIKQDSSERSWGGGIKEKYGLYNAKSKVFIPAEYDACPEFSNGHYRITSDGLVGIINSEGVTVLKPEWKQILFSNGYYVVSKIEQVDYNHDKERFGLTNLNGDLIIETKYDAIAVLRDGFYKVQEDDSWTIFNDEGRLSDVTYTEICVEGNYFIVSKHGLSVRLNEHAEKVIKSDDGTYIILPSKYEWASDFKDGTAKVLINGYENYIDKTFNLVIVHENQIIPIDKSIDYLVSNDNKGNYIFVSENKYGIINLSGEILIEAKYEDLSHFADELYIAEIITDGKYNTKYGIINVEGKTVLSFEYSSIKPYGGKVPCRDSSWDNIDLTGRVMLSKNIVLPKSNDYWLIHKNGYGLIDRYGNVCIQPIYEDIQLIGNCFHVKKDNNYGLVASDYSLVCNPKYVSISSVGNGLWKVSIIKSNTSNLIHEVNTFYGIIDSEGIERLKPIYQFIGDVNDELIAKDRAVIKFKGQLGLVDENYHILVEPQFKHISNFKNDKSLVIKCIANKDSTGESFIGGAIDINGNFTDLVELTKSEMINNIKSEIKTVKTLKNGLVVIQRNDQNSIFQYCAVVDNDGNIILPYKYHRIEEQKNGMYLVFLCTENGGYYGLLDQNFYELIAPKYAFINQIQDVFAVRNTRNSGIGLINSKEELILPCIYSSIIEAGFDLVWISQNNGHLVGLATTKGNILLSPTYGEVGTFKNGFATVNNGFWYEVDDDDYPHRTSDKFSMGKWGVINEKGQLILPTIFDCIKIEEDTCFSVSKEISVQNENGYSSYKQVFGRYNTDGEPIIKNIDGEYILASKKYDWQDDFDTEGRSRVYYKGNIGFVNEKFKQVVSCLIEGENIEFALLEEYDWGYDSPTQFVFVEKNSKKGVIDHNNNIVIKPNYDRIDVFGDTTNFVFSCGVQSENHSSYNPSYTWSIFDVEGNSVIEFMSKEIIHIGFSLLAIKTDNNKYSIVDFNGQLMSDTLYDTVLSFGISSNTPLEYSWEKPKKVDGLKYAIVGIDDKYGIIDNHGRLKFYPKYSSLFIQNNNQFLADGVLINTFEQKISVTDNFVFILPEGYDKIEKLDNGLLLVSKNNLYGCINQIGTVIIPLKYSSLKYQSNLLIAVYKDNNEGVYKRGVINFQERQIVSFCRQIEEIKIESEIILYEQDSHWGAYTLQGKVICEPLYDHIVYVTNNLIKVGMDGKDIETFNDCYWGNDGERYDFTNYNEYSIINWGLIDINGNEILPLEYNSIADKVIDGLIEIRLNKNIGYVDVTGRILLEPIYKSVGDFIDGYAIVSKASSFYDEERHKREKSIYGVINSLFKEIIPCVFDSMTYEKESGRFMSNLGYITIDGRYVAKIDGEELILDNKYQYCKPFNDTCAIAVQITDGIVKYGLVDKKSCDILPPIFSDLNYLGKKLYAFKINDLYGLVNFKGSIIVKNVYNAIRKFEADLACVQVDVTKNGEHVKLYGFIDSSGKEILPPLYEYMGKRYNKYAVVMKNNQWGLFSMESHQLRIFTNAAYLGPCMDNLCKINIGGIYDKAHIKVKDGLWGYINVDGQIVIEPTYENVCNFSEGMAAVKQNDKWGFINVNGEIVVPCNYDIYKSSYKDGEGELVKNGRVFVFDNSGKQIDSYLYDEYDAGYNDAPTYNKYGGYNGYSDQTIDEAFGGDPSLTWNCD